MPQLTKRFFGKKDMFILFADYSIANAPMRPDGYDDTENICPIGINEHFFYFPYQNKMLEINMLNGNYNAFPCSDVKQAMFNAAKENQQILEGYTTASGLNANDAMTEFLGNYLLYVFANSSGDAYGRNDATGKLYDIITNAEFVTGYRLDTTRHPVLIKDFSPQERIADLETYLENIDNLKKAEPARQAQQETLLSSVEAMENMEDTEESPKPLLKKYVSGDFDCYCLLVDYDQMALPWPDGFETPEKRVENQAPVGINDNYAFYCHNNQICYFYFGECKQKKQHIANGVAFNHQLLDIAVENEKLENENQVISSLVKLLENMIRIKHGTKPFSSDANTQKDATMFTIALFHQAFEKLGGEKHTYSLDSTGRDTDCGNHMPDKFVMIRDGKPVTLEDALDSITG
ncbi:MAG: hypothetical protein K1W06_10755 [Lachnospiraceae bacterium]